MIAATYINTTSFSVDGSHVSDFPEGRRIMLVQDGVNTEVSVNLATYSAGTDLTTITIKTAEVTEDLTEIKVGPIYVAPTLQSSNLAEHNHTADWDGGSAPFGLFTSTSVVSILNAIGVTAPLLNGIAFFTEDESVVAAAAPDVGDSILKSTSDNTAYEFVTFEVGSLVDVELTTLANGHALVYDSVLQKFTNKAVSGGGGGEGSGSGNTVEQDILYYLRTI